MVEKNGKKNNVLWGENYVKFKCQCPQARFYQKRVNVDVFSVATFRPDDRAEKSCDRAHSARKDRHSPSVVLWISSVLTCLRTRTLSWVMSVSPRLVQCGPNEPSEVTRYSPRETHVPSVCLNHSSPAKKGRWKPRAWATLRFQDVSYPSWRWRKKEGEREEGWQGTMDTLQWLSCPSWGLFISGVRIQWGVWGQAFPWNDWHPYKHPMEAWCQEITPEKSGRCSNCLSYHTPMRISLL